MRCTFPNAALLDDRDIARSVAHHLVDRRREYRRGAAALPPGLPPQPKMIRSASSSAATSTIPSAALRPIRTTVRNSTPCGRELIDTLKQPPRLSSLRGAFGKRHAFGDLDDPKAVRVPPGRSRAAPTRIRSAAVRGFASGMQDLLRQWRSHRLAACAVPRSAAVPLPPGDAASCRTASAEVASSDRRIRLG